MLRSSPSKCARSQRLYVRGSVMPFGEDSRREFKGHRNLCVEELPRWCFVRGTSRRSRRAVSRTLNGFLNTGHGGTVYLGVLDDGSVKGLSLSPYQMDHVCVSLTDLMNRYNPPVPKSRYKVEFVPVVEKEGDARLLQEVTGESSDSAYSSCCTDPESEHLLHCKGHLLHCKGHLLRTSTYCWCDKHAVRLYNKGILMPDYVVEITITQFVPNPSLHPSVLQLHPVHEDEEERCYFRRTASLQPYMHQEVVELTVGEVRTHFEKVLERLRREYQMCSELLTANLHPT